MNDYGDDGLEHWPVNGAPIFVNRILRRLWIEREVLRGHWRAFLCRELGHELDVVEYSREMESWLGTHVDLKCSRCGWERAWARWFANEAAKRA